MVAIAIGQVDYSHIGKVIQRDEYTVLPKGL